MCMWNANTTTEEDWLLLVSCSHAKFISSQWNGGVNTDARIDCRCCLWIVGENPINFERHHILPPILLIYLGYSLIIEIKPAKIYTFFSPRITKNIEHGEHTVVVQYKTSSIFSQSTFKKICSKNRMLALDMLLW